jgi:hypothetical protein
MNGGRIKWGQAFNHEELALGISQSFHRRTAEKIAESPNTSQAEAVSDYKTSRLRGLRRRTLGAKKQYQ